jgi:hypothetical protein
MDRVGRGSGDHVCTIHGSGTCPIEPIAILVDHEALICHRYGGLCLDEACWPNGEKTGDANETWSAAVVHGSMGKTDDAYWRRG